MSFGYAYKLTTKGTTLPLFSIDGSSIEQRQEKKVHWRKRDSVGEMKEIGSKMVESNVLIMCHQCSDFGNEWVTTI